MAVRGFLSRHRALSKIMALLPTTLRFRSMPPAGAGLSQILQFNNYVRSIGVALHMNRRRSERSIYLGGGFPLSPFRPGNIRTIPSWDEREIYPFEANMKVISGERLEWNDACSVLIDTCTVVLVTSLEGKILWDVIQQKDARRWLEEAARASCFPSHFTGVLFNEKMSLLPA